MGSASDAESERLSDQAWEYQRERQLRDLGIDPETLDGDR